MTFACPSIDFEKRRRARDFHSQQLLRSAAPKCNPRWLPGWSGFRRNQQQAPTSSSDVDVVTDWAQSPLAFVAVNVTGYCCAAWNVWLGFSSGRRRAVAEVPLPRRRRVGGLISKGDRQGCRSCLRGISKRSHREGPGWTTGPIGTPLRAPARIGNWDSAATETGEPRDESRNGVSNWKSHVMATTARSPSPVPSGYVGNAIWEGRSQFIVAASREIRSSAPSRASSPPPGPHTGVGVDRGEVGRDPGGLLEAHVAEDTRGRSRGRSGR